MIPKIDCGYTATQERFEYWLKQSAEFLNKDLNETETRNKIIDPLFKEVLGWNEKFISREGHLNALGFYDYEFESEKSKFILEAKREYVPFQMPTSSIVKAKSLKARHSKLSDAIFQGVNYAAPKQINVVVVSNGVQFAVTYIPNLHTNAMDTVLFSSHEKLFERFLDFYSLLSPLSEDMSKCLINLLCSNSNKLIRSRPIFTNKIIQNLDNPSDILPSNQLASFLGSIHDKYFTEIINDWDLLKKCYVDYERTHQYEKSIEIVLRDRAPRLGKVVDDIINIEESVSEEVAGTSEIVTITTSKKNADIFDSRFVEHRHNTKMFLLIGGAGVGKTTFIHRFFNFILSTEDQESTVWVYLDCKECAKDTNLDEFVYKKIEDELYRKYKSLDIFENVEILLKIFADDLNKKKALLQLVPEENVNAEKFKIISELMNDKEVYIKRIFEYLQKQGFSTCVVYDNVDQLDSELQKRLFQHGNAIKDRFRTTLILSLREEVYYQHENDKSFNFSDCDVFHIPAPKIFNVLSKRLKVAKEEFTENDVIFNIQNSRGMNITLKKLEVLEVLTQTFLGSNDNILLLEMLTNGDVRESLRVFKRIVSSPNMNYDVLLSAAGSSSIKVNSGDKRIKYDDLLRSLALENRVHYSSTNSKIINVFEINNDGYFSHFTKLRILLYAASNSTLTVGTLPKGFFKVRDMYNEIFNYTVKDIESFLDICLGLQKEGALCNLKGTITVMSPEDFISLGASGYYYLNYLKSDPYYLALVSIDTLIANKEKAQRIEELYNKSLIASEFQRNKRYLDMAKEFVDYLLESEKEEATFLESIDCPNLDNPIFKISESIKQKIDCI